MVATLRVMLDQLATPTEPELAEASRELARGSGSVWHASHGFGAA
jgi:hypothetical protein